MSEQPEQRRRQNGLSTPYSPTQLSTWVTLPTLMLQFGLFVTPILPMGAAIPSTIVVFALGAASAYYAWITMKIDPSDPRLHSSSNNNTEEQAASKEKPACEIDPSEPTKVSRIE
jgi:hypothetical protein